MITIFCDGASKKNPGICGIGAVISQESKTICEISEMIGNNYTNNIAEYCSVLRALYEVVELNLHNSSKSISVVMDSELVIKQLKGEYKVKQEHLQILHKHILSFISKHNLQVSFIWVPREQNTITDNLANQGIEKKIQTSPFISNILNTIDLKTSNSAQLPSEKQKNNQNQNFQESSSNQLLIAEKVFFSKTSCLKFQISKRKEMYIHIGTVKQQNWEWIICKFSDVEIAEICSVILGKKEKCAFFHKNSHKGANSSTQIWCNSNEKGFSIKIQNHSKLLSIYEADVLYELMRRGIWEINAL
ncbi:MAG: ribonuclease HI family protein [Nanoarchaeota archaeon]|nr:ribonuclease HI family protein [Nanoarchaeota archaeon]